MQTRARRGTQKERGSSSTRSGGERPTTRCRCMCAQCASGSPCMRDRAPLEAMRPLQSNTYSVPSHVPSSTLTSGMSAGASSCEAALGPVANVAAAGSMLQMTACFCTHQGRICFKKV